MQKYTLYHVSEGTLFEASDTQPGQHFYLASDVDARIADSTNRIGRQEARLMFLERRLFECESAMLMGHYEGIVKYCNKYPEPIEAPSPY